MFPLPINFYIYAGIALISAFAGFYVEHLRFENYQIQVESIGKQAEEHTKAVVAEQKVITDKVSTDYENKIANIKQSYSNGLQHSGSGSMSVIPNTTIRTDDPTAILVLAEQCTETTQQLVSLQQWVNEQVGIK